uniref:Putative secreted protein n=1 Tax=Amblyomma cajennense TaxID=34607 RepID=A0A023FBF4_AMBCJ
MRPCCLLIMAAAACLCSAGVLQQTAASWLRPTCRTDLPATSHVANHRACMTDPYKEGSVCRKFVSANEVPGRPLSGAARESVVLLLV